jgi:hypothetical protein
VIKIPTSRWILYDAVKFNDKVTDPDVPMILQERAITSPIWYSSAGWGSIAIRCLWAR